MGEAGGTAVTTTLQARGRHYEGPGGYADTAMTAQQIKDTLRAAAGWKHLTAAMRESLDMIANKLARVVNGDPFHADSWHDIAGYATLAEKHALQMRPPHPLPTPMSPPI